MSNSRYEGGRSVCEERLVEVETGGEPEEWKMETE